MTLREVMHSHIPRLTLESTVRDAVDKMDVYQFPALVVSNSDDEALAVVTEGDICRAVGREDGLWRISSAPAHEFGTHSPVTIDAGTEIGDALHAMLSQGLTLLPVMDSGRLAGIVLRVDLMQAILCDFHSRDA
jgi:CBS domain-containing protein